MEARHQRAIGVSIIESYAATCRPQASQNLLFGWRAAPQRSHAERPGNGRPQVEQKTASGSGRGPQVLQDLVKSVDRTGTSDGATVEAERSARTLAAIMASISSEAASIDSCRNASNAAAVYLVFSSS